MIDHPADPAAFRSLPSVDELVRRAGDTGSLRLLTHELRVMLAREIIETARERLRRGDAAVVPGTLERELAQAAAGLATPHVRPIINATGVILHTNLGRAPLEAEMLASALVLAGGYTNLEFDLEDGQRGDRLAAVREKLCRLTGAEAALVVNNNAAAMLLAVTVLGQGREVLVSRGEAVEIGGGFRIPEVVAQSGARLVEVGTTNRTYATDYRAAITPQTAAILRVHSSNFRVIGFTARPEVRELANLAGEYGIILIDDVGSGCLIDTAPFGLAGETDPRRSLAEGADLVGFSGDKLLGGPQSGIIAGRRALVERLARHPLQRALRADKLSLAALEMTLLPYLAGEALERIPIWRMIAAPSEAIAARAAAWVAALSAAGIPATVEPGESAIGGGSLPGEVLPTSLVVVPGTDALPASALARRLRLGRVAIVGRIQNDALVLDPRTVLPAQDDSLLNAVVVAMRGELP